MRSSVDRILAALRAAGLDVGDRRVAGGPGAGGGEADRRDVASSGTPKKEALERADFFQQAPKSEPPKGHIDPVITAAIKRNKERLERPSSGTDLPLLAAAAETESARRYLIEGRWGPAPDGVHFF